MTSLATFFKNGGPQAAAEHTITLPRLLLHPTSPFDRLPRSTYGWTKVSGPGPRSNNFVSTQPTADNSMRMTTDPAEVEAQNKVMRIRGGCIPCPVS